MKNRVIVNKVTLKRIHYDEINEEEFDDVSFVPMLAGKSEDGNDV